MAQSHHVRGHHLIPLTGIPGGFAAPSLVVADLQNGGGFVATLTGGDAAAVNTLYRARFTGRTGTLAWAATDARVGPGVLTGTAPPGYYLWQVSSALGDGQAWSAAYYANLSDAADPLHERILQALVATLNAMALPDVAAGGVLRLELPDDTRVKELRTFPCVAVVTFGQQEDYVGGTSQFDDTVFPAFVSYITRGLWTRDTKRAALAVRQAVRRGFRSQRLAGVSEVMSCELGPGAIGHRAVSDTAVDYLASSLPLKFKCREPRGLGA